MREWYMLDDDHNVIGPFEPTAHVLANRRSNQVVARTTVYKGCDVSTVFLGLDHRSTDAGLPIVFETMVFGGPFDEEQARYCTWDEAVAGHALMVEKCQPIMTEG